MRIYMKEIRTLSFQRSDCNKYSEIFIIFISLSQQLIGLPTQSLYWPNDLCAKRTLIAGKMTESAIYCNLFPAIFTKTSLLIRLLFGFASHSVFVKLNQNEYNTETATLSVFTTSTIWITKSSGYFLFPTIRTVEHYNITQNQWINWMD